MMEYISIYKNKFFYHLNNEMAYKISIANRQAGKN